MPVLALGISYRRAPVELLERLSFASEDQPKAYRQLLEMGSVAGGVLLSTCNRVEVFAEVESYHAGFLDLKRFLSESREVPAEDFAEPLYSHYEDDAADHLFSVASGLDSMVVGEPQILTQVRRAYGEAEAEGATGPPTLARLFRAAIRTGRRVRAEMEIGASPAAMVEAGVTLAEQSIGELQGRSVLAVGAGGMGALAVKHVKRLQVGRVRILSRRVERARALAAKAGGQAGGLETLAAAIAEADLVVSSTGAPGIVIGADIVRGALRRRSFDGRGSVPLFLLDLAVPRDVDPRVARLPGVRLADIDDLRSALPQGAAPEMERARAIVAEEVRRFVAWKRTARLAPLIQSLRDRGARIQALELARAAPKLTELSDREWAAVEAMASGIVAKLLHEPIVRLKGSGAGETDSLARALADLFGLDPGPGA